MIVGAGLAGLIAAHAFPQMSVIEARPEPTEMHRALLRFRSPAVGEMTGIEFRPVTVRKGIWNANRWTAPNIRVANLYSRKVLDGETLARSIWDVEPVTRYIAPESFYEQLVDAARSRISWGTSADYFGFGTIISTAPMPVVLSALGIECGETFLRAPISVRRYRLSRTDVHQTVYFPTPCHTMYRASITGSLLICEFAGEPSGEYERDVARAFALRLDGAEPLGEVEQQYGKIAPINEGVRRGLVVKLTADHGVFSLGRFATWRNILLDDVVHDISVVKRLLTATDYERRIHSLQQRRTA